VSLNSFFSPSLFLYFDPLGPRPSVALPPCTLVCPASRRFPPSPPRPSLVSQLRSLPLLLVFFFFLPWKTPRTCFISVLESPGRIGNESFPSFVPFFISNPPPADPGRPKRTARGTFTRSRCATYVFPFNTRWVFPLLPPSERV